MDGITPIWSVSDSMSWGGYGDDDDDDFVEMQMTKCRDANTPKLSLASFSHQECYDNFRFSASQIPYLAASLGMPRIVEANARYNIPRDEALCITLYKLAYPQSVYLQ